VCTGAESTENQKSFNFSIKSLNCNSLSIGCSSENYDLIMDAVCNLGGDIIFLSDIRMGQLNNTSASTKIQTTLLKSKLRNHEFLYNSSMNKRGVAILINKNIQTEIIETFKDQQENILLIKCKLNGSEIILGSIYGPNTTDREFYNNIDNYLTRNPNTPVVLGGAWNTTWNNSLPETNLDIMGMARTPNMANGRLLRLLSDKHSLTDPFRVLFPDRLTFTYHPFGQIRQNKSRLDFFVISTALIGNVTECSVFPGLLSKQFDHKPVCLTFGNKEFIPSKGLKNWFLEDEIVGMSTELAALQVYSKAIDPEVHPQICNELSHKINRLVELTKQCLQLKEAIALNVTGNANFQELLLAAKISDFKAERELLPEWDNLEGL
jgi:exonuclease III